ncbi:hypothetical protein A2714_01860 [Candidatus Woesebacteria bacterium RIFCSPHIGHO2_01_FULL_38_9]|uniref:Type II secretion system protein GspG C-terminal domain-containing protein n=2 Tax=Candidatus Woeseibacteriota TaxID=1752722 RepID=A0A1F7Y165_9BACT|nr:MAG: hypothetical protein A2714_01860 [Candidatus Woesebacteria bacterium RIFCSPHIGHO2_01_FULL_38_9]OGM58575.1 MAG: hypothetical protein A3A75_02545 [Candidatus Woesebacteria bacterium RIFCSPLOWO2_01_FULL_39_10]
MFVKFSNNSGFTFIELIMVMGIIGLLAGFVSFSFPASLRRARDTRRQSDLKQWQTSLETYGNKNNGIYYASTTAIQPNGNVLCQVLYPAEYPPCPGPADPRTGQTACLRATGTFTACNYQYESNAGGTTYVLFSPLEAPSDTTKPYFIICSVGVTGYGTAANVANTDGVCPI